MAPRVQCLFGMLNKSNPRDAVILAVISAQAKYDAACAAFDSSESDSSLARVAARAACKLLDAQSMVGVRRGGVRRGGGALRTTICPNMNPITALRVLQRKI